MSLSEELRRRRDSLPVDEDLVFATHEVSVELLREAYPLGIFPWPFDQNELIPWVCPIVRAILPFDQFRLGRSSQRGLRRAGFTVTRNQAFPEVIRRCASVPGRETWIFPFMQVAYSAAHRAGFAESVEVWRDGNLVGGLYGIYLQGCFSGESMFHTENHAGKAAVQAIVTALRARGCQWMDIQQLTPHMAAMGAVDLPRPDYLRLLTELPDPDQTD